MTPKKAVAKKKRLPSKPGWKDLFIAEFAKRASVRAACARANISRKNAYEARKQDPEFAARWKVARAEAIDKLEEEAWRRAHDGVDEPVFGSLGYRKGSGEIGTIRKYSDKLLLALLQAHKPSRYRQTVRNEHTGPNGGPIPVKTTVDLSDKTDEQVGKYLGTLATVAAKLAKLAATSGGERPGDA